MSNPSNRASMRGQLTLRGVVIGVLGCVSFKVIDCLITNFHLPQSTLVMLVLALAGREHVLNAYKEAVEERYRFFSFGDAMFITNDMHMDDEAAE